MDKIIEDKELGRLIVRDNVRAKRLVFRTKADAIYVSIPPGVTMKEVKEAIEKLRSRLLDSRQKLIRPLIDLNYRIDTEYFKLSLVSGKREKFLAHSELGEMRIICPPTADFTDSNLQDWLRKVTECKDYLASSVVYAFREAPFTLRERADKFEPWAMGKLFLS